MQKSMFIVAIMMLMAVSPPALAHDHGDMDGNMHNPCAMGMDAQHDMSQMHGGFLTSKEIDGYLVSFRIMKAPSGMDQGGNYHVMVKFEKDGRVLTDLVANSKAVHPNGESESKMLMKMGEWYMAAYDLDHKGQHHIMVLFKAAGGTKHFGGIYFPEDKKE
ncbi:MAG: hypothetical protein Q9M12_00355 [Mariprofundus sp.]|nr:hypothetical protein [Mariprofundus sp.]